MSTGNFSYLPATALAKLIRTKQVSPVEVVESTFERISEVNSDLNCFCFTYPEEAIQNARLAERDILAGWLGSWSIARCALCN